MAQITARNIAGEVVEIPGNNLYELLTYVARHHPEQAVIEWLLSELEQMEKSHETL